MTQRRNGRLSRRLLAVRVRVHILQGFRLGLQGRPRHLVSLATLRWLALPLLLLRAEGDDGIFLLDHGLAGFFVLGGLGETDRQGLLKVRGDVD